MAKMNFEIYSDLMKEIKLRTNCINSILTGSSHTLYSGTNTEFMALQLRMILELVALSSLSLHEEQFEQNRKKFVKHWHPKDILGDIERVNPNFYPKPFIANKTGEKYFEFVDLDEPYLKREQLIKAHGICGSILHAQNRFNKHRSAVSLQPELKKYLGLTVSLLNNHLFHLPNDNVNLFVVHMNTPPNDEVKIEMFVRET